MFWSYCTRTSSDCRPCIVLSVLRHVKHFKAVYRVKSETKANLSRTHWLHYCIGVTIDVKDDYCMRLTHLHSISIIQQYIHILALPVMGLKYVCVQGLTIQQ